MRHATIWCVVISVLAGNMIGLSIGYVPVILQSYSDASNCTWVSSYADRAATKDECLWNADKICTWNETSWRCNFYADALLHVPCKSFNTSEECESEAHESSCQWGRIPGTTTMACDFQMGWSKTKTAVVASISTLGGIVGSFLVHFVIVRSGVNRCLTLSGFTSVLAAAFLIIGWTDYADESRWGLVLAGRFLTGVVLGMTSVAVPMYIGDIAPREKAGVLGVGFQVSITFGILTASAVGYASNPSRETMHPRTGVALLNYYYLLLSIALIPVSMFADKPLFDDATRNSLLTFRHSAFLRMKAGPEATTQGPLSGLDDRNAASLFSRPLYVAVAILIAAGQQLSGINMLISYVTTMASDLGVGNPYLAGFIGMGWNFASTLVAIWLAYRMSAGDMFLLGELVAAFACFVVAVPIWIEPAVVSDAARAVVVSGLALFIFAFEFGMGPSFYVLAQSMFPSEIRSAGCSFTIFCQFIFNGIVNFLYPVVVAAIAGGSSKPQSKGIAGMFFIFGAVGLVLTATLRYLMNRIRDEVAEQAEEFHGVVETRDALTQY